MVVSVATTASTHNHTERNATNTRPQVFVSRLLGRGDWKGFVDRIQVRVACVPCAVCVVCLGGCGFARACTRTSADSRAPAACAHTHTQSTRRTRSLTHPPPTTHTRTRTQDAVPEESMQEELMDSIGKGHFTLRILCVRARVRARARVCRLCWG